jgi:hypothetical protein
MVGNSEVGNSEVIRESTYERWTPIAASSPFVDDFGVTSNGRAVRSETQPAPAVRRPAPWMLETYCAISPNILKQVDRFGHLVSGFHEHHRENGGTFRCKVARRCRKCRVFNAISI